MKSDSQQTDRQREIAEFVREEVLNLWPDWVGEPIPPYKLIGILTRVLVRFEEERES